MKRVNVRAKQGLEWKIQGKIASKDKVITLKLDHNVQCHIRDGSLIVVEDTVVEDKKTTKKKVVKNDN